MAGIAGLEPTHTRVKVWCLTDLAISQNTVCRLYLKGIVGAPGRNRTPDTRIRSPLLYPAELQAHIFCGAGEGNRTLATSLEGWGSTTELHPQVYFFGGDERIRTTESKANGFTVRPIWPTLEHPQIYVFI